MADVTESELEHDYADSATLDRSTYREWKLAFFSRQTTIVQAMVYLQNVNPTPSCCNSLSRPRFVVVEAQPGNNSVKNVATDIGYGCLFG